MPSPIDSGIVASVTTVGVRLPWSYGTQYWYTDPTYRGFQGISLLSDVSRRFSG